MEMFFHFSINDYILIEQWVPQTIGAYVGSLAAVFFLAILGEALRFFRSKMEERWTKKLEHGDYEPLVPTGERPWIASIEISRAVFHMVDIFVHYTLMLVAMTFNAGLFFAIIVGSGTGVLIFSFFKKDKAHEKQSEPINDTCH